MNASFKDLKFVDCPTNEIHKIKCPVNKNDFTVSAHVNPRQPLYILDDAVFGKEVEWVGQLLDLSGRHRSLSHLALPTRLFHLAANVKVNMV